MGRIAAATDMLVIVAPEGAAIQSMVALPFAPAVNVQLELSELGGEEDCAFVTAMLPGTVTACVHPAGGQTPSSKSTHW